jgi:G3E family GTPase
LNFPIKNSNFAEILIEDIMDNMKKIPVLLLTGYLGSGKTTLVNKILANKKGIKFAVIVNDIGEVNIDENLIEQGGVVGKGDDSLVALSNGCICCTLKMDLVQQICDLVNQDKFDYIVIEASGICEPAPIAQTICSIPSVVPNLLKTNKTPDLDSIVTVVDAKRMKDEFDNGKALQKEEIGEDDLESLVIQQIEFCNTILLNKASELTKEELGKLKGIIRAIQPKAEIIETNYCDVDFDKIINTHRFDFNKVATSAAWLAAVEGESMENEESGEALEYGIETFVYNRRPPFDLGKFDEYISTQMPKNIIRCKGLCYFRDELETCYVFEQAGKQVNLSNAGQWYATMPEEQLKQLMEQNTQVKKDWDEKYGDRMEKLVFIGQNLDKEAITKALDECLDD